MIIICSLFSSSSSSFSIYGRQVKRFDPRLGPWEGGTNVTIEGVNLGKTFSDIAGGITVAGMPCHPFEELYVQTRRIVCLVDSPKNSETRRGPVIVRVSNFKGESADYYEFVNPIIESIHPSRGPLSGGTQLTIRGQFMNAGSSIQAVIDPSLTCAITSTNSSHAICRTSASNRLRSGELQMSFDRGVRRYTRQMYQYVEDPTIEYAESGVVSQVKVPKGVPSGGIIISVAGNNLEYIQVR
jgi:plexin A